MITIINYGMGNLGSIKNMLTRIGEPAVITAEIEAIRSADKLILPGVGAFDKAMLNLQKLELIPVLNELVLEKKIPILGICLGMQIMSKNSEEGNLPGLGWIDSQTKLFQFGNNPNRLRVPHMGWNTFEVLKSGSPLDGLPADSRFYFVHSYYVCCQNRDNVLAVTRYGIEFHSAIIKGNILGTQFHPEKSHKFGMQLLKNFAKS